jgi:hypothetical protein
MRIASVILVIFISLLLFSCVKAKKNVNDYFPKVKTLSAVVNTNGDVTVSGEVDLSQGSFLATGFCVDTLPDPLMTQNQVNFSMPLSSTFSKQYNNNNNTPQLTFRRFSPFKTYYFRSWAANEYGYIYGNTIALENIVEEVHPPCNLARNMIDLGKGGGSTPIIAKTTKRGVSLWEVEGTFMNDTATCTFYLSFWTEPQPGVYNDQPNNKTCIMTIKGPGLSIDEGNFNVTKKAHLVYVQENPDHTLEITLCDAPYGQPGPLFYTLSARFTVNR